MEVNLRFVDFLEFIGTFAFAISGIRLASAKRFDWFGAYIVGLVTAVGGGTLRDFMLGVTPFWILNPITLIFTACAFLFVVLFRKNLVRMNSAFFMFDTIGLALFVVVGFSKSIELGFSYWIGVVMGMLTGAFGGVIRDILINEVPLIFHKEIYAIACIAGGTVFAICEYNQLPPFYSEIFAAATVVIMRILAVRYQWCLPVLKGEEENMSDKKIEE